MMNLTEEKRKKALKLIGKLQEAIKGGAGSGPRPGGAAPVPAGAQSRAQRRQAVLARVNQAYEQFTRALTGIVDDIVNSLPKSATDLSEKEVEDLKSFFDKGGPGSGPRPGHGRKPDSAAASRSKLEGATEFKGAPANPKGRDSMEMFKNPDGSWTKERAALHDQIVKEFMGQAKPVKEPTAYMLGGGPASGKSSAIKGGHVPVPKNHVAIDADEIKKRIPEYNQKREAKDVGAASFAHEESSYLSKRILSEASKGSYNTLLDGTGDSGLDSLSAKVKTMRANGAKVSATYVTVDTKEALRRNVERAQKPGPNQGRMPPETMVKEVHKTVSKVVPEAIKAGLFDDFKLVDTNGPEAVVVATAQGTNLKVHNQALWDRFLAKGNE
jgi:predicted ABC-type ATPase